MASHYSYGSCYLILVFVATQLRKTYRILGCSSAHPLQATELCPIDGKLHASVITDDFEFFYSNTVMKGPVFLAHGHLMLDMKGKGPQFLFFPADISQAEQIRSPPQDVAYVEYQNSGLFQG